MLHVIPSLPIGGAEQLIVNLARHIDSTRYELHVGTIVPLDETSPMVRALRTLRVPLYSLNNVGLINPSNALFLAALARRIKAHLIHTHLNHADTFGGIAALLTRTPLICTYHLPVYDPDPPFSKAKQLIHALVLRQAAWTVVATAPEIATGIAAHLHLPANKIIVVPNSVDVDAIDQVERTMTASRRCDLLTGSTGPLVLTVGTVKPSKAHEYLVEATALLVQHFPGIRVCIAGQFYTNEPLVRERITALGMENHVTLLGARRDVVEMLAAADLFVLSSVMETLPLALLEAMAVGTPIAATAVDGIPGVIIDEVTGRLAPPREAEALAAAMDDLLSHPQKAGRLAVAARSLVRDKHGVQAYARRMEEIYDTLIMQGRALRWDASCGQ